MMVILKSEKGFSLQNKRGNFIHASFLLLLDLSTSFIIADLEILLKYVERKAGTKGYVLNSKDYLWRPIIGVEFTWLGSSDFSPVAHANQYL